MLEPQMSNEMNDSSILAKKGAAVQWCANASLVWLDLTVTCLSPMTRLQGTSPWRF